MNEISKNEMRNYLSAAGFFVLALSALIVSGEFFGEGTTSYFQIADLIPSVLLLLIGVLLAVLGKRDLTSISFLMFGSLKLLIILPLVLTSITLDAMSFVNPILLTFYIIFALILLTAKDKAKYPLALIIGLEGLFPLVWFTITPS